ncbi:MAG TPA: glycoside hydrolase family 9 protein [Chryseolinea sp.]
MKRIFDCICRFSFIVSFSLGSSYALSQTLTKYIVVDQFGYLPASKKIAVIRDPQVGFDASESFTPGPEYALVSKSTGQPVFTAAPVAWKSGATDNSSGDRAWWFDFSSVTTPGSYYVVDAQKDLKSFEFEISSTVYNGVLRHAVRTFFYQRVGFAKPAQHAGAPWADGASHLGPLQDKNARPYNEKNNALKEVDVSGGWFDAGDYNKYTNWTANYVVDFMRAYLEAPGVWTDDYNIPESGNGIPDLLDEARWGIDHLLRMQQNDGSVLSIVGLSHASPPSSATGQSLYGTASTSATLNTAGAFALASKVYREIGMTSYADLLKERAVKAWDWSASNPNVIFRNNDVASGTSGLGAGQQETDDYGRSMAKVEAACFLFEVTGEYKYKDFMEANYSSVHLMTWNWASMYEVSNQEAILHYASLPGANAAIASQIRNTYKNSLNTADHFLAHSGKTDPYLAHINQYGWGSNSLKALQGLIFTDLISYGIDPARNAEALQAAETFIHYIHGVNPLNMVYLSNMYDYGGDNCANEFYHTWFANGSALWDRVGTSTYGPPPGFVPGGPNPTYNWDSCCPAGCGGSNNSLCTSESLTPPKGQPAQKSYKDFNTSWPLNSWEVTENSNSYQLNYIRLLSKFVEAGLDCNGTPAGTASFDACNRCAGGTTGVIPITDPTKCSGPVTGTEETENFDFKIYPNPSSGLIQIESMKQGLYSLQIINSSGKRIMSSDYSGSVTIDVRHQPQGIFIIIIDRAGHRQIRKVVKF